MEALALKRNVAVRRSKSTPVLVRPIRNARDLKLSQQRISALMSAKAGTPEADELFVLAQLVDHYERSLRTDIRASVRENIEFHMEQFGRTQADLSALIGANRASEFLKGRKNKLSLGEIRKLRDGWGLPVQLLID